MHGFVCRGRVDPSTMSRGATARTVRDLNVHVVDVTEKDVAVAKRQVRTAIDNTGALHRRPMPAAARGNANSPSSSPLLSHGAKERLAPANWSRKGAGCGWDEWGVGRERRGGCAIHDVNLRAGVDGALSGLLTPRV